MFDKLKERLSSDTDVGAFTESLTERLGLPSVYRPVLVHRESGRQVNDSLKLEQAPDIDVDALTTVGDLATAIETGFADRQLSAKLLSPTDTDGIDARTHLKTLRDAG